MSTCTLLWKRYLTLFLDIHISIFYIYRICKLVINKLANANNGNYSRIQWNLFETLFPKRSKVHKSIKSSDQFKFQFKTRF